MVQPANFRRCNDSANWVELFRLRIRISSRVSLGTLGRPACPCRTFQVQYQRNPRRCQPITVAGFTIRSADRHRGQHWNNHTHKRRSACFNLGLGVFRCSTPIWCRSPGFLLVSRRSSRFERDRAAGMRAVLDPFSKAGNSFWDQLHPAYVVPLMYSPPRARGEPRDALHLLKSGSADQ